MQIQVKNGVLARQQHKDGSDAGFSPLAAGIYEVLGPEKHGHFEIKKDDGINVFVSVEKLDAYLKAGEIEFIA